MRKWEYIAKYCEEKGYAQSAAKAWELDQDLLERYPLEKFKKHYQDTAVDPNEADHKFIRGIILSATYCIACRISKECFYCEFGIAHGKCMDDVDEVDDDYWDRRDESNDYFAGYTKDGLFGEFLNAFHKEHYGDDRP